MSNTGRIKPADIRPPQTKAEAVAALALAKSRLEGAERSLADGNPKSFSTQEAYEHWQGRATYAIALWREKVTELEYLLARFESEAVCREIEFAEAWDALEKITRELVTFVGEVARDPELPSASRERLVALQSKLRHLGAIS